MTRFILNSTGQGRFQRLEVQTHYRNTKCHGSQKYFFSQEFGLRRYDLDCSNNAYIDLLHRWPCYSRKNSLCSCDPLRFILFELCPQRCVAGAARLFNYTHCFCKTLFLTITQHPLCTLAHLSACLCCCLHFVWKQAKHHHLLIMPNNKSN